MTQELLSIARNCDAPMCLRHLKAGQGRVVETGGIMLRTCYSRECIAWAERKHN